MIKNKVYWYSHRKIFVMKNNEGKKRGPKDRDYVNKSQPHQVRHEPKRKKPAKKFGDSGGNGEDADQ